MVIVLIYLIQFMILMMPMEVSYTPVKDFSMTITKNGVQRFMV